MLLASCAVGPDFVHPAAPEITRYTREPLAPQTSKNRRRPKPALHRGPRYPPEWWAMFKSPARCPDRASDRQQSQSAIDAGDAARRAAGGLCARKAKESARRRPISIRCARRQAVSLSPATASGASIYNLYTAQVLVSYTFDVWGLNRRTVEIASGARPCKGSRLRPPTLRWDQMWRSPPSPRPRCAGQIEATNQLIAINSRILGIFNRLDTGYGNASDVAVGGRAGPAKATLPPLRKALARPDATCWRRCPVPIPAKDCARGGVSPTCISRETCGEPALTTDRAAAGRVRAAEEQLHAASALVSIARRRRIAELHHPNSGYPDTVFAALIAPQAWPEIPPATRRKPSSTPAPCCISSRVRATWRTSPTRCARSKTMPMRCAQRATSSAPQKRVSIWRSSSLDKGQGNVLLQLTAEQPCRGGPPPALPRPGCRHGGAASGVGRRLVEIGPRRRRRESSTSAPGENLRLSVTLRSLQNQSLSESSPRRALLALAARRDWTSPSWASPSSLSYMRTARAGLCGTPG